MSNQGMICENLFPPFYEKYLTLHSSKRVAVNAFVFYFERQRGHRVVLFAPYFHNLCFDDAKVLWHHKITFLPLSHYFGFLLFVLRIHLNRATHIPNVFSNYIICFGAASSCLDFHTATVWFQEFLNRFAFKNQGQRAFQVLKIESRDHKSFVIRPEPIEHFGPATRGAISEQSWRKTNIIFASALSLLSTNHADEISVSIDLFGTGIDLQTEISSSTSPDADRVLNLFRNSYERVYEILENHIISQAWPLQIRMTAQTNRDLLLQVGENTHTPRDIAAEVATSDMLRNTAFLCMCTFRKMVSNPLPEMGRLVSVEPDGTQIRITASSVIMEAVPNPPKPIQSPVQIPSPPESPDRGQGRQGILSSDSSETYSDDAADQMAYHDVSSAIVAIERQSGPKKESQDVYGLAVQKIVDLKPLNLHGAIEPQETTRKISGYSPAEFRTKLQSTTRAQQLAKDFGNQRFMTELFREIARVHGVIPSSDRWKNRPSVEQLLQRAGAPFKTPASQSTCLALIFLLAKGGYLIPEMFDDSVRTDIQTLQQRIPV
jgi:hypothetical protein